MKRFFCLGLVFSVFLSVATGQNMRILVTPFANNSSGEYGWLGFGIEASVISDIACIKSVQVIGTQDRKKALEEQALQLSGLVEAEKVLRVGRMLGANLIITGEYTAIGQDVRLTARLLLAEKGQVIASVKKDGNIHQIFEMQDEIVIGLLGGIDEANADGFKKVSLSEAELASIRKRDATFAGYEYASKGFELNAVVPQEFLVIEQAIFKYINQERQKAGLTPFLYNARLAALSRYHSMNMQIYNFFDLTDQNGMGPLARKLIFAPEIFGNVGQMVASLGGGDPDVIAKNFVNYWMQGEFKSVVLSKDWNYIGVGIYRGDGNAYKYYCTVTPANLWVELVSSLPKNVPYGSEVELTFRFIGNYPKDQVGIIVRFPDPDARYFNKDSSFSTGSGLFKPERWDGEFFTIKIMCDKGRGAYMIQPAKGTEFVPYGMTFTSR
ncbi:MAG: hypothetical protein EHM28_08335 [Spirochaetaceae bacterium]|nr:MAG: hypothetical protein EHM28_08335 [Spirochaetaceae bacterium]